jgi:UDP-3-O-[3-hydroxymyristoyl] glucosamine N-acyltransferase
LKATDIARAVSGRFEGGADPDLTGAAPLDLATASDLALLTSRRYLAEAACTQAGALLVTNALAEHVTTDRPRIIVDDAHHALTVVLPLLYPQPAPEPGVHPTAVLGACVELGERVAIGAHTVVGEGSRIGAGAVLGPQVVVGRHCRVGAEAYLHPHVTLYDGVTVGARSILHAGVQAGVDGFGYSHRDGRHVKVLQVGRCEIGADVEIGANCTIDRGSIGSTVIGDGCKIDNLVHIGHNVRIGDHCIIVAQTGIAGSTRIGKYVTFGGQAGINGHIRIGDGATIAAQAGVFGDVPPGVMVSGYPARPHREALRGQAAVARLPRLWQRLRALERAVFGTDAPDADNASGRPDE